MNTFKMPATKHKPATKVGPNLFHFQTNGDLLSELLRNANCIDIGGFLDQVSPGLKFPKYEYHYSIVPIGKQGVLKQVLFDNCRSGLRREFCTLRELLQFVIEFPNEAMRLKRIPAFGLDIFSYVNLTEIPTVRFCNGRFELYKEHASTIWNGEDGPLKREVVVQEKSQLNTAA